MTKFLMAVFAFVVVFIPSAYGADMAQGFSLAPVDIKSLSIKQKELLEELEIVRLEKLVYPKYQTLRVYANFDYTVLDVIIVATPFP